MLRFFALAGFALVTPSSALAQNGPQALNAQRVPSQVKHAGVLHVSAGTWTRSGGAVSNFGPDTVYSNTVQSGYFFAVGGSGGFAPGAINFDEGNLPSSTNTNNPGNRDDYAINCVGIGYCDSGVGASGWQLSFYSSYVPCTFASFPDKTFNTGALPSGGCWTVDLDLSGCGDCFCLGADGGDGFDDDADDDAFGWSFRYTGSGTGEAGFLLAGDPQSTDPNYVPGGLPIDGTNTYFGPASLCSADEATGLQTMDFWYLEDPAGVSSGCYFFGGYGNNFGCGGPLNDPFASWYLELHAELESCNSGSCASCGGSGNPCLSNPNSTGVNSTMVITGSTSVAADDVTLTASVPPNSTAFFITAQTAGFVPFPGGSAGNLCLGNDIGRFQQLVTSSGSAGQVEISTVAGQWSLSSIPQASGPYAAQAGGTAHFQCWHRDITPAGSPTSNLSDSAIITWTP